MAEYGLADASDAWDEDSGVFLRHTCQGGPAAPQWVHSQQEEGAVMLVTQSDTASFDAGVGELVQLPLTVLQQQLVKAPGDNVASIIAPDLHVVSTSCVGT